MVAEKGRVAERGRIQTYILLYFFRLSLRLPPRIDLCEGHMYCLWPLPHLVLVCTAVVHVLFVATPL